MSSKYVSSEYVDGSDSDSEVEVPEYAPPAGYKKFDPPAIDTSKFKQKELWLIKCPKGLDLSKLKKLPVSFQIGATTDLKVGNSTFNLTEDTYQEDIAAQSEKSDSSKHCLLVNGKTTSGMKPSELTIQKYYTISEKVKIPSIDYEKAIVAREDVPKEENLRMRHFPTGYGANDYNEAKAIPADSPVKRPNRSEDHMDVDETPKKKSKKEKKDKKEKKERKHKERL
ncbi:unnamed protein product [Kuraishia capsulata CBS 1993]|uniref:DNA-directed RNA polymerase I subunit RPA34 n=1 Tax=Kuraishia capsulata CBS 1993 TaxID=1382522 RepID=W6MUJ2_9ASCO|nr:uncharacterized protein KUCA_T00001645001 [Kuraishia capsulata CBS 1993]CDK25675.1 unnamed protein product [Kuraishia capsulata CBS 1993]